uniref:Uncharacterized protein n=1 Tax=Chenopodium quinoa TaxID=63459 RepID=A0A803L0P3_CHEQI
MSNQEMILGERRCEGHELPPGLSQDMSEEGLKSIFSDYGYEITYYTKAFDEWKMLKVKDLDGDWLVSFEHDGVDEDIRALHPKLLKTFINLIIKDTGYEVYSPDWNCTLAALSFQHRK